MALKERLLDALRRLFDGIARTTWRRGRRVEAAVGRTSRGVREGLAAPIREGLTGLRNLLVPILVVMGSSAVLVLRLLGRQGWLQVLRLWDRLEPTRQRLFWWAGPRLKVLRQRLEPRLRLFRPWASTLAMRYRHGWGPRLARAGAVARVVGRRVEAELRAVPWRLAAALTQVRETGSWQMPALIGGAFALLSFWITAPAWLLGPTHYLVGGGENPDWTGTAWAYWWTGYSLQNGLNVFDGNYDFFPVGQRPVAYYNLLDGLLGAPFMLIFGPVLGYNLFAVFTVWTAALAMYGLGRSVGVSRAAAALAGIGLVTSNFFGFELRDGRLSQTLLVFWIVGFTGLERLARGLGTWRLAVLTGVMVAATSLVYWYNGLFLVIAALPLWLVEFKRWDLARLRRLAIAVAVTLLITGPYVVSLAEHFRNLPGVSRDLESWMNYGEYGRGEFGLNSAIRHSHWPLWPFYHPFMEPDDHRVAAGILVLGLGILVWRPKGIGRWLAVMGAGYLLTLGPYLKGADDQPTNIHLPYLFFYDHVPFFDRLWWPGRMALIFLIPLLVLAAMHLDRLASRWPRWRGAVLALGLLSVVADMDTRNAFIPIMGRAPEVYNAQLYDRLDGGILTTPVLGKDPAGRHHLWFQIFHEQPILYGLGAHIASHRPPGYESYIKQNSLLSVLANISDNLSQDGIVAPADVDRLVAAGFRWAVVDPTAYTFDYAAAYWRNFTAVFYRIWGPPDVQAGYGLAWHIEAIRSPVIIQALPSAGPTEFGKAPVMPGELSKREGK